MYVRLRDTIHQNLKSNSSRHRHQTWPHRTIGKTLELLRSIPPCGSASLPIAFSPDAQT